MKVKRLGLAIGMLAIMILACSQLALAGLEEDVTVTATPSPSSTLPSPPTNFVATEMGVNTTTGINTIEVTWTMGYLADNTTVRVSGEMHPASMTDGYLAYNGTGTSFNMTGMSLGEDTPTFFYFSAWSENGLGYSVNYATTQIGGVIVRLILFGILGLGMTFGFFWKKSAFFAYGAAGAWALLGFQAFQQSASASPAQITDTYMALFWLCMAFVIGCALLPAVMREKRSPDDIYPEEVDEVTGEPIPKEEKETFSPRRFINNFRRRKASRFSRTGQE